MKRRMKKKLPRSVSIAIWSLILLAALYFILLCCPRRYFSYRLPLRLAEQEAMLGKGEIVDYVDGKYAGCDSVIVSLEDELLVYRVDYSYSGNLAKMRRKYNSAVLSDSTLDTHSDTVGSWGCCGCLVWDMKFNSGQSYHEYSRSVYVRCTDAAVTGGKAKLKLAYNPYNPFILNANIERLNSTFLKITFQDRHDLSFEQAQYAILELSCRDASGTLLYQQTIPIREETEE